MYITWKVFSRSLFVLLVFLMIASAATFGVFQLSYSKQYLANILEKEFSRQFNGDLQITEFNGLLPYQLEFHNVYLFDRETPDTIGAFKSVFITLRPWDLLRNTISIQSLQIDEPKIRFITSPGSKTYTLQKILERTPVPVNDSRSASNRTRFEILAPLVEISNGTVYIDKVHELYPNVEIPNALNLNNINFSSFVEINDDQSFFDIQYFFFEAPALKPVNMAMGGQVFYDKAHFELNAMQFKAGSSFIELNLDVSDFNNSAGSLFERLNSARFSLRVDSSSVMLAELLHVAKEVEWPAKPIHARLAFNGTSNAINMDQFHIKYGGSEMQLYGNIKNSNSINEASYDITLRNAVLLQADMKDVLGAAFTQSDWTWNNARISGNIIGDAHSADMDIDLKLPFGAFLVKGNIDNPESPGFNLTTRFRDVNLQRAGLTANLPTALNGTMQLKGKNPVLNEMIAQADIRMVNSRLGTILVPELTLSMDLNRGVIRPVFEYTYENAQISGTGDIDVNQSEKSLRIEGLVKNLNLAKSLASDAFAETDMDAEYAFELSAASLATLSGFGNMDITRLSIGDTEYDQHQLYFDFNPVDAATRRLRFTSNILDLNAEGSFNLDSAFGLLGYWGSWLAASFQNEVLLSGSTPRSRRGHVPSVDQSIDINSVIDFKNVELLNAYYTDLNNFNAAGRAAFQINADRDRFLITGGMTAPEMGYKTVRFKDADVQFTANFRSNESLKDFSSINVIGSAAQVSANDYTLNGYALNLSMVNDSIALKQRVNQVAQDFSVKADVSVSLLEDALVLNLDDFRAENPSYLWVSANRAAFTYSKNGNLQIEGFSLFSDAQSVRVDGTFSNSQEDSVLYVVENLKLDEVSKLVKGRIDFAGNLNGIFSTKSLFSVPAITGFVFVDGFSIGNRIIGDMEFTSNYNSQSDRFETQLAVQTDTVKYRQELAREDVFGTKIDIQGYFYNPAEDTPRDTLFYFDVNMPELDLWVVDYITPDLFQQVAGRGEGRGFITGSHTWYDFYADFDVLEATLIPEFLLSSYRLNGRFILDKNQGLSFDNMNVADTKGGTGILYGSIDLNDFKPEKMLNLNLEMRQLEFLNNRFAPEIAFYGTVAGTGTVNLSGLNVAPYLRTVGSLVTTANSRLSIPLLDETSVDEQARFIEFVSDFSEAEWVLPRVETTTAVSSRGRRFLEIFTLDLSFDAPPGSTVQLVFDPLTGEILNARGSGRVRITLEDENIQVFGNFGISEGDYTFVAGDIFVRRFQLRNGGSISWDGNPDNARLNIPAAYRTRPDLLVLSPSLSLTSGNTSTRIPVDLILVITGTLNSIENDFYFEFPNAIDVSQNATELALLNSEEQKLIQATSLLFTGGFLPVGNLAEGQGSELGTSLQQRAGTVGLSQLLSGQINALLNSSLSNLDIDLNLTGFNQADLGVALRLFDDRLVLRGESQLNQGNEATLGDLGATYRINRALSIEVFHRRDPTLRSIVGNQTQAESINGVGLEAQIQFNTWKELRQRLWGSIRRLFTFSKRKQVPSDVATDF